MSATLNNEDRRWFYWFMLAGCLLMVGCSFAADRYHPAYQAYSENIRTVLLMRPEIKVFEEMADGALVEHDVDSRLAQKRTQQMVSQSLSAKQFSVKNADDHLMGQFEAHRIQALFRAVNRSIQLHTYGPQIFPAKLSAFDYAVGSVADLLATHDADALVLAIGHQTISPVLTKAWISIALVEPNGQIIWYAMQGAEQDLGLDNPDNVRTLVDRTLRNLTGGAS